VNQQTQKVIRAAEEAVSRLVEECRKDGTLYAKNPRVVAQVNRTCKWLLNAIDALHRAVNTPGSEDARPAG
jgi:hypothetical protein